MFYSYVISIKKPRKLLKQIERLNLIPIWIEAVDKSKLTKTDIKENTTALYNSIGPISCVAIAMSHLKTWKTFLQTNKEFCIVFEDDVVFENNFTKDLGRIIENTPKDFDILNLGYFQTLWLFNLFSIAYKLKDEVKLNKYVKIPKMVTGLHAYVLSRKGASLLIELIDKKINNHVDVMICDLFINGGINIYVANRRIAYQTSTDMCDSSNSVNFPIVLSKITNKIKLDKLFSLNYYLSIKILRIWNMNLTPISFIFFLIGIFLALYRVPIRISTLIFFIISLPDICIFSYIDVIIFNYLLFIIPSYCLRIFK